MKRQLFLPIFAFALGVFMTACHTAERNLERGHYDDAVDIAMRKLEGKRRKKEEHVRVLEAAFQKATERDMRLCDYLQGAGREENWAKINQIHRRIEARQNRVFRLLPLTASSGYKANFMFVNIEQREQESREKAAEHLYQKAQALLTDARRGDKMAARTAYDVLEDIGRRYFPQYKDKAVLLQEARRLGTIHVLVGVHNSSQKILPRELEQRFLELSSGDMNHFWRQVYLRPSTEMNYDYRVVFDVRRVDISPENVKERHYVDENEIVDGWEYVLDQRGNVAKDTAGNDIKRPRYVRVRAEVLEVCQTKAARLSGALVVTDAQGNTHVDARNMNTEIVFENFAATFRGDERALSEASRKRLGNRPLPFPADEDMIAQAADRLRPAICEGLRSSRAWQ